MIPSDMLLILLLMKELDIQIKFYSLIKKYRQSFFLSGNTQKSCQEGMEILPVTFILCWWEHKLLKCYWKAVFQMYQEP